MLEYYQNILQELKIQKQEIINEKKKANISLIDKCNLNKLLCETDKDIIFYESKIKDLERGKFYNYIILFNKS